MRRNFSTEQLNCFAASNRGIGASGILDAGALSPVASRWSRSRSIDARSRHEQQVQLGIARTAFLGFGSVDDSIDPLRIFPISLNCLNLSMGFEQQLQRGFLALDFP
jgi:hypothetical protein